MKKFFAASVFCVAVVLARAKQLPPVLHVDHGPNAPAQMKKHYVVLVSLDGFRYDYAKKYGATYLLALARHGASAPEGMLPSYPSTTFPNHYTLVTGLYPEHHGIVATSFYDPVRKQRYAYKDSVSSRDGSWYGGTPLWVLAEQQGMRAACFFWPGSEAEIRSTRPTYYLNFNNEYPDEKRLDQVDAWLHLPAEKRPHLITLYYANVDRAGHKFGPDAPETAAAVKHVDGLVGDLEARLRQSGLPVDLVVVSDHGMAAEKGPWIDLSRWADLTGTFSAGALLYPPDETTAERLYQQLKIADGAFVVYRRSRMPAYLHYNSNPREGDPVIVPSGPYSIRAQAPAGDDLPPSKGVHGYDPREMPEMRAIFYAEGPDILPGSTVKLFENVNVYPLIAHLLGLDGALPPIDGSYNVLSSVVAEPH